jgi:hypothetical protein
MISEHRSRIETYSAIICKEKKFFTMLLFTNSSTWHMKVTSLLGMVEEPEWIRNWIVHTRTWLKVYRHVFETMWTMPRLSLHCRRQGTHKKPPDSVSRRTFLLRDHTHVQYSALFHKICFLSSWPEDDSIGVETCSNVQYVTLNLIIWTSIHYCCILLQFLYLLFSTFYPQRDGIHKMKINIYQETNPQLSALRAS